MPSRRNSQVNIRSPSSQNSEIVSKLGTQRKIHSDPAFMTEVQSNSEGGLASTYEVGVSGSEEATAQGSYCKLASDTDRESAGLDGSTIADALLASTQTTHFRVSDTARVTSVDIPEAPTRTVQLCGSGRALIKEYFEEATPVRLSRGHPTIALNENQVSHMLKVVADEAVGTSLKEKGRIVQGLFEAYWTSLGTNLC